MDLLDRIRQTRQKEREREERFALIRTEFSQLSPADRELMMGLLLDELEGVVGKGAVPVAAPTVTAAQTGPFPEPPPVVRAGPQKPEGITAIVQNVVNASPHALTISQIAERVAKIKPGKPKSHTYSAVYKLRNAEKIKANPTDPPTYSPANGGVSPK